MDKPVTDLADALIKSGPAGAMIAAVIIALVLAVIVFVRTKDLWSDSRDRSQSVEFQARLLKLIDDLRASERALRQRIDEMDHDQGAMRDQVDELRASLALVRNQRRRLIELLRSGQMRRAGGAA